MLRSMIIEERVRSRARRQKIQNIVLASVYAATVLGTVIVAPNAAQLLGHFGKNFGPKQRLNRRISQAVSRLYTKGFVTRTKTDKGIKLSLTKKGSKLAQELDKKENLYLKKPKRWDGKWRIVIFDVWERRRDVRDKLRNLLQKAGFIKIQDSVWVYPYDCEELFTFLRVDLRLGKGMLYIVAEEVEHDEQLRSHFRLPLE